MHFIDEIRELRDKVYVAPVQAAYKVYIIDEVHMLTREAFNALLKTLEEPPSHVVFILATTEAHKLPQTIISRTQRYSFKPADTGHIEKLLSGIAKEEKVTISDDALRLIAEHASGSYRDAVSLLDQASSVAEKVTSEEILQLLGVPPTNEIANIIEMLQADTNPNNLLQSLESMYQQGYQASNIAKQLSKYLRKELTQKQISLPISDILQLLSNLIEVPVSYNPEQKLEICLLQAMPRKHDIQMQAPAESFQTDPIPIDNEEQPVESYMQTQEQEFTVHPDIESLPEVEIAVSGNDELWQKILSDMKIKYNTLYGIVRMAKPEFVTNNSIVLTFNFEFHKKRLEEAKNRKILEELLHKNAGKKISVKLEMDNKKASPVAPQPLLKTSDNTTDSFITISNIFGGGELLES
jgi:DNA polymerase-3 subunit gamma/tau